MKSIALMSFIFVLIVSPNSMAENSRSAMLPAANKPSILERVGIDQKLGTMIPSQLVFSDEYGRSVRLADFLGKRPVILVLVYYQCPMLCTMVLNDLLRAMRSMPEMVGKDFDVLTVSFDPRDTPELALRKKNTYLAQYNRLGAETGWHFLTGQQPAITALTDAVGFHYAWDPKFQIYAHASGIMVMTPQGKLSRYFFGIDYAPKDLRVALTEATDGHIGSFADSVLLYCYCYDPTTGKYGLAISRLLKTGGVLILVLLGIFVSVSLYHDHRNARKSREALA
ncbi:MAG TPA: SCO family protein [Tepidisphaeraceae bacterium]|jgi:protein SCO1/2|nr:SCO family protein [Tepidisphaeraceae bacterium]